MPSKRPIRMGKKYLSIRRKRSVRLGIDIICLACAGKIAKPLWTVRGNAGLRGGFACDDDPVGRPSRVAAVVMEPAAETTATAGRGCYFGRSNIFMSLG